MTRADPPQTSSSVIWQTRPADLMLYAPGAQASGASYSTDSVIEQPSEAVAEAGMCDLFRQDLYRAFERRDSVRQRLDVGQLQAASSGVFRGIGGGRGARRLVLCSLRSGGDVVDSVIQRCR